MITRITTTVYEGFREGINGWVLRTDVYSIGGDKLSLTVFEREQDALKAARVIDQIAKLL